MNTDAFSASTEEKVAQPDEVSKTILTADAADERGFKGLKGSLIQNAFVCDDSAQWRKAAARPRQKVSESAFPLRTKAQ